MTGIGKVRLVIAMGLLVGALGACGDDGAAPASTTSATGAATTTTAPASTTGATTTTEAAMPSGTVRIGVVMATSGGAAFLGVPERAAIELFEATQAVNRIGNVNVEWIYADDESDPTNSVTIVKRMIENDGIALILCCSTTPITLAIQDEVNRTELPNVSVSAGAAIANPVEERYWTFKVALSDAIVIEKGLDHMVANGWTRLAFLAFDDAYGDSARTELEKLIATKFPQVEIVGDEEFNREDTDVTAQLTRLQSTDPDAYLIWGIPPASNVVQQNIYDLGIEEPVYHGHGVAQQNFLDLGGEAVEGVFVAAGNLAVIDQVPDDHPLKASVTAFKTLYEAEHDAVNNMAGNAWDASLVIWDALVRTIESGADPNDLPAFRAALRDQIESTSELVGTGSIFNYSPTDHQGVDARGAVVMQVLNNQWTYVDY